MSFSDDVKRYAKKANLSTADAIISINVQLAEKIIEKTPVDKGTAQANWNASLGVPDLTVKKDAGSQAVLAKTNARAVAKMSAGKIFYLSNNVDYIRKLEYGGFDRPSQKVTANLFSKQAPRGMVRISIAEIKRGLK